MWLASIWFSGISPCKTQLDYHVMLVKKSLLCHAIHSSYKPFLANVQSTFEFQSCRSNKTRPDRNGAYVHNDARGH
jgi:hypothetical protein